MHGGTSGARTTTPPRAAPGRMVTRPGGEQRLVLEDLQGAIAQGPGDEVVLSLGDILLGNVPEVDPAAPNRGVKIRPVNLKALAAIERAFGSMDAIPENPTAAQTVTIATILVNQDRAVEDELTEDQVSRLYTAENMPALERAVRSAITPLFASAAATPGNGTAAGGPASSTTSPRSSASRAPRPRAGSR